jgi:hypothetical protein
MTISILVCLVAFLALLWLIRRNRVSLGLPIASLYSLLLIHVPGAFAHAVGRDFLLNSDLTTTAMRFTALGSICFLAGVWIARTSATERIRRDVDDPQFWWFCLIGGWTCVYALTPLYNIPSVAATVDKGGAIWMLGVLLGLRSGCRHGDLKRIAIWLTALMVYPVMMLLFGGFLSYGSAAIIVVGAVLTVSTRNFLRVLAGVTLFTFISLSIFVTYFQHRTDIRNQVWGGAPLEARVDSVVATFESFQWFNPADRDHLIALDERLNQNFFVGLAARRIRFGQAQYLWGDSVREGLLALVPRAFWPDKPVFGGSPKIVAKMTGLRLDPNTSFGVGNIMEFQVNFGIPGIVVGFLLLGWAIGKLDFKAAVAISRGDLGKAILFFLPCVAMIQPNGSIVEITGGSAAALVAAYGWRWMWAQWRSAFGNNSVFAQPAAFLCSAEKLRDPVNIRASSL